MADGILALLEEMTLLETSVQRRINLLLYADIESAYEYLVRVFGLGPGELTRDDDGTVVHGEIHAGDGVVWLSSLEVGQRAHGPRPKHCRPAADR